MKSLFTVLSIVFIAFLVVLVAFFILSSSAPLPENEQHPLVQETINVTTSEIAGMTLNQGHKWQMDEHTHSILAEMKSSVISVDTNLAQTKDLKLLGNTLQTQLDTLIQGCTMVDAEHDQLHIFLTGYIPALNALSETGSIDDVMSVKHYLTHYSRYFK